MLPTIMAALRPSAATFAALRSTNLNEIKMLSSSRNDNHPKSKTTKLDATCGYGSTTSPPVNGSAQGEEYARAIHDLNLLQSNTQSVALAKYKNPRDILPLFERQLNLAGIKVDDLDKLNIIHITGTKGKGSTCAFLESILRAAGLKTGFYNSPHLIKVTERIKLNGEQICEAKFSKYFRQVYDRLVEASKRENISLPSYFSFLTILAYHIFLEEKVDCAITEVGIGGAYDPTNIIKRPVACGITSIHYDHTNILGDTIEQIAQSKAGIAKHRVPLFTVKQEHRVALEVIRSKAEHEECPLFVCKPLNASKDEIQLGINGTAQLENASLACQIAEYYLARRKPDGQRSWDSHGHDLETDFDRLPSFFKDSLATCSFPGRCQRIDYPKLSFYLDGAHTKESMENCLNWFLSDVDLKQESEERILMVNVIGDRNKFEILKPLAEAKLFHTVIFSTNRINSVIETPTSETFVNMQSPNSDKSMENVMTNAKIWTNLVGDHDNPKVELKSSTGESIECLIDRIHQRPRKRHKVLVTGSLHFVGAVLETIPIFHDSLINTNGFK